VIRLISIAALAVALAGCAKQAPPAEDTLPDDLHPGNRSTEPTPTATELERRRDAACEKLGPRMTACAIDDARHTMSAEELAKLDVEHTAPIHTREFVKACKAQQLSSRQVRVYEVCLREETDCDPLIECLDHANPVSR
jgi:hypothetical protein